MKAKFLLVLMVLMLIVMPAGAVTAEGSKTSYGFFPSCADPGSYEPDWGSLTHVSYFCMDLNSDGTLSTGEIGDNYYSMRDAARSNGVKVTLTLRSNDFNVLKEVLENHRDDLASNILYEIREYDADGICIYFDGVDPSYVNEMEQFMQTLHSTLKAVNPDYHISLCIVWNEKSFHYDKTLAEYVDTYVDSVILMSCDSQFQGLDPTEPVVSGDNLNIAGSSGREDGPDDFGYTFKDSSVTGGPSYDWIEISETGTDILLDSDDDVRDNVNIGFFFNYYGTDYSRLAIANNGLVFSVGTTTRYVNEPITQSPEVHGFIAPYWDDLGTWGEGKVYYQTLGTAPDRTFVVEWVENQHYGHSDSGATFEAILYEGSNNIEFQYKDVDFGNVYGATSDDFSPFNNGGSATVGIEGPDGTDGLQYSFNEQVIEPGLSILFTFPQSAGTNLYLSEQAPECKENGTVITYLLHYHNFGDTAAQNVFLEDELSEDVEFESASEGGTYYPETGTIVWELGTVAPGGHGCRNVTVRVPQEVLIGTVIHNDASIGTSNLEVRYDDNEVHVQTRVVGSTLPPGAGIEPTNGGPGIPSVYWRNPLTFSYHGCESATAVDIMIHINDGGPDIVGNMAGGPPDWTYATTFYPRYGRATVTYTVYGCDADTISFDIYIDPSGYIYDIETGERIAGASVWLQRPDGSGGWENVPAGEFGPDAQPDVNPQVTGEDGMYRWDIPDGSYRFHAEAPGYEPGDSVAVSLPPPLFDLHIGLVHINVPPVANAGGPYEGTAGVPLTLNGSGSYDPDESRGDSIVLYEWDLDGDNLYDDATGAVVDYTLSEPYSGEVGLRVTDSNGDTGTDRTTINIVCLDLVEPEINDVELNPVNATPGSTINIIVNTTDNVEVRKVSAGDAPLKHIDGFWRGSIRAPVYAGDYSLKITARDGVGNTAETIVTYRVIPPQSISDIQASTGPTWINWTWSNPGCPDFNHTEIYLNGSFQTNTSAEYFNATCLQPETGYTIGTRTVDIYGNVNETWVNATATTEMELVLDIEKPVIESVVLFPASITAGATIDIEVNATDDMGVAEVKAGDIPLTKTDGIWKGSITAPISAGDYSLRITVKDEAGNTAETIVTYRVIPPQSISDIQALTGSTWINWTWSSPDYPCFSHTEIYLDGIFQTNTSGEYFNATGLQPETGYTIGTRTVDIYGNVNGTWVNATAITKKAESSGSSDEESSSFPSKSSGGSGKGTARIISAVSTPSTAGMLEPEEEIDQLRVLRTVNPSEEYGGYTENLTDSELVIGTEEKKVRLFLILFVILGLLVFLYFSRKRQK